MLQSCCKRTLTKFLVWPICQENHICVLFDTVTVTERYLEAKSAEQSNTGFGPVLWREFGWDIDRNDKVRRVTGSGQSAASSEDLVQRALVCVRLVGLGSEDRRVCGRWDGGTRWHEPDRRERREQLLGSRCSQSVTLRVPTSTLEIESVDEDAIARWLWRQVRLIVH